MNNSLSEKLLHQLYNFTNLTQRQHHKEHLKANDLSIGRSQVHLLSVLLVNDGLTQKELSMKLQIRPASLGELVDKLEQNGYVERCVNENDKRVSNVYLREEGRILVNAVIKSRSSLMDNTFSGLSEEEKNQLSVLMGKLMDSLNESLIENTDGFEL
jgi:DNA-binding MarR family transcriptional regulator